MNITEIKDYDKKRKKIIIDEGSKIFLLYIGELRRLGLKEGDDISEEEYISIENEILNPRAKKRVIYYLKNGEKTEAEVRRKLKEGFYPEEVINQAISFLEGYKFVDDGRYADNFAESKKKSCSRREIEMKLYRKGVSKEKIREAIKCIEDEDELSVCIKLLKKRIKNEEALEDPAEKRKNYAYLMRKGFGYDIIEQAFGEIRSLIY